jgi:hypothetical protein
MKGLLRILVFALPALLLAVPASAIDAEVELRYWQSEATFSESGFSDESDGTPGLGLRAEIVPWKKLAVAGEYYQGSGEGIFDGVDFSHFLLDAKWRIIAPTDNTFFAVGLGYQTFELSGDGETLDTDGIRLVADGRFGFVGILYVYGRLAYLPSVSDIDVMGMTLAEGDSAYDLDLGLGIEPLPLLSIWVGYRTQSYDFSEPGGSASLTIDNTGPYIGAGVHF